MRPSPLAEPGILLRMIAPEPDDLPRARASSSALLAPRTSWGATGTLGAALAAFVFSAMTHQRTQLPFGRDGQLGWLACGAVVLLATILVRLGDPRRQRREVLAAMVAGLVALAAAANSLGAAFLGASWLGLAGAFGVLVVLVLRGQPAGRAVVAATLGASTFAAVVLATGPHPMAASSTALLMVVTLLLAASVGSDRRLAAQAPHAHHSAGQQLRRQLLFAAAAMLLAVAVAYLPGSALPTSLATVGLVAAATAIGAVAARLACGLSVAVAALVLGAGPVASSSADERVLATHGELRVCYARGQQELRLYAAAELIDANGPARGEAALATVLVQALAAAGDRVLVLGQGSGRIASDLLSLDRQVVDVVDWRPAGQVLRAHLLADGPVLPVATATPAAVVRHSGLVAGLAALSTGARQIIVLAEPLAHGGPQTEVGVQHELRAVVGAGFVLQVLALDRTRGLAMQQLFAAAVVAHRWNGLFVVGDAAVLVSGDAPIDWPQIEPLASWSPDARWMAHEAHVADVTDLERAWLGRLVAPTTSAVPTLAADALGRPIALDVIHAWLGPRADEACGGNGLLSRYRAQQAELRAAAARIRSLANDAEGRATAQGIAARFLHVGAPLPELQAALGLPTSDGVTLMAPGAASRRAFALDPTFFQSPPAVCSTLPLPNQVAGDLEDLSVLPPRPRLAEVASGDDPFAVALRVRFPSRCARALVEALANGALTPSANQALRELADAFVLREAAAILVPRARARELLGLWRGDLPMPNEIEQMASGSADDRRTLAAALRGRRDPSCFGALAILLEADEVEVRELAAVALEYACGDRVPYDPNWLQSARHEAAQRLRSLHNRAP